MQTSFLRQPHTSQQMASLGWYALRTRHPTGCSWQGRQQLREAVLAEHYLTPCCSHPSRLLLPFLLTSALQQHEKEKHLRKEVKDRKTPECSKCEGFVNLKACTWGTWQNTLKKALYLHWQLRYEGSEGERNTWITVNQNQCYFSKNINTNSPLLPPFNSFLLLKEPNLDQTKAGITMSVTTQKYSFWGSWLRHQFPPWPWASHLICAAFQLLILKVKTMPHGQMMRLLMMANHHEDGRNGGDQGHREICLLEDPTWDQNSHKAATI